MMNRPLRGLRTRRRFLVRAKQLSHLRSDIVRAYQRLTDEHGMDIGIDKTCHVGASMDATFADNHLIFGNAFRETKRDTQVRRKGREISIVNSDQSRLGQPLKHGVELSLVMDLNQR